MTMFKNPLSALVAIVVIGVSIEVVERQSRQAAYALLVLILLGVITFNSQRFAQQTNAIIGALAAPVKRTYEPGYPGGSRTNRVGTPANQRPRTEPGIGR